MPSGIRILTVSARLLKHLAAMGVIGEAGPDLYRRTGFTIALCSEKYSDGFPLMYVHVTIVHPDANANSPGTGHVDSQLASTLSLPT